MIRKTDNKGFAAIAIVLIVMVIAGVAGIGYYIWQQNNDDNPCDVPGTLANCMSDGTTDDTQVNAELPSIEDVNSGTSRDDVEKATTQIVRFSTLPQEAQSAIQAGLATAKSACVKDGKLVDSQGAATDPNVAYSAVGSVILDSCNSKDAFLFAMDLKEGSWAVIEETANAFNCDSVFNHPVPKSLLQQHFGGNANCIDPQTGKTLTYDEAFPNYYL